MCHALYLNVYYFDAVHEIAKVIINLTFIIRFAVVRKKTYFKSPNT